MSKKRQAKKTNDASRAVQLLPPLQQFQEAGLVEFEAVTKSAELAEKFNANLSQKQADTTNAEAEAIAAEFVSVQAEVLIASASSHKAGEIEASFEKVILREQVDPKDSSVAGYYIAQSTMIELGIKHDLPLDVLLAHEMTHAIDDIYDNRYSGERVRVVLKSQNEDVTFQNDTILKFAELVGPTQGEDFAAYYYEPMVESESLAEKKGNGATISFTRACSLADMYEPTTKKEKAAYKRSLEAKAANLSIEFASFTCEGIFAELKEHGNIDRFISTYNKGEADNKLPPPAAPARGEAAGAAAYTSPAAGGNGEVSAVLPAEDNNAVIFKTAQEIIAVSIYDINELLIKNIQKQEVRTPSREALLTQLQRLEETIAPAYMRVADKIAAHHSQEAIKACEDYAEPPKDRVASDTTLPKGPNTDLAEAHLKAAKRVSERIARFAKTTEAYTKIAATVKAAIDTAESKTGISAYKNSAATAGQAEGSDPAATTQAAGIRSKRPRPSTPRTTNEAAGTSTPRVITQPKEALAKDDLAELGRALLSRKVADNMRTAFSNSANKKMLGQVGREIFRATLSDKDHGRS